MGKGAAPSSRRRCKLARLLISGKTRGLGVHKSSRGFRKRGQF